MKLPETYTKRYYTIGETAAMLEVSKSNIRYWESEFSVLRPHKTSGGERRYTAKDIANFVLVYRLLKEKGYTIEGARNAFAQEKKRSEMLVKLQRIKEGLIRIREEV